MDVGLELLQPFLVDDAETLLLVDDDEAEISEFDRLRDNRVGADDDVGCPLARRRAFSALRQPERVAETTQAWPILTRKPLKRSTKFV